MRKTLLFTVSAAIAFAGCSEGSPLEPQYDAQFARTASVNPNVNAPSDPVTTVAGPNLVVGWTDNSKNEQWFEIQRTSLDGQWGSYATTGRNVASYTDENAAQGTQYKYRVRACSASRSCSTWAATRFFEQPGS